MVKALKFSEVARMPMAGDNAAIAVQRLEAGTTINCGEKSLTLSDTILEGHRFAVESIDVGKDLLSWNYPFGVATRPIAPGSSLYNNLVLKDLRLRDLGCVFPSEANFEDRIIPYTFDDVNFQPGQQVVPVEAPATFMGFRRGCGRGVGTRNYIVIIGVTSRTGAFARSLADQCKTLVTGDRIDGVVAVAHTEGGTPTRPNNFDLLMRTLCGFMVHSNVAAVLVVDDGRGPVNNQVLADFAVGQGYPLDDVRHAFLTVRGRFADNLRRGEYVIKSWLDEANGVPRTEEPVSGLRIAQQCGGSDAFSGISGNPLSAFVVREILRHGGSGVIAETNELIGAEDYMVRNVKDAKTARRFVERLKAYRDRLALHGCADGGNPSGGNKVRGLYNVVHKSLGAAVKRHPEVRIDGTLEYGERMSGNGYFFMDSPGNDLESIAGEVASGCNLIFFVTGNGSVTNFPFVPTIKIITTSGRYRLLPNEMDVNAGEYLEGRNMEAIGAEFFDLALRVGSGEDSKGERLGHSQVSIWRNWPLSDGTQPEDLPEVATVEGNPLPIAADLPVMEALCDEFRKCRAGMSERIGLILPVSLCAGQVARMTAEKLTSDGLGSEQGISRYTALVHTEGCGFTGVSTYNLISRSLIGYMTHPMIAHGLFLEHGCEKIHNDYVRNELRTAGLDPASFGWASVQLDGGIENVMAKIEAWFKEQIMAVGDGSSEVNAQLGPAIALASVGNVPTQTARTFAGLTRIISASGGTVLIPENDNLLQSSPFLDETIGGENVAPTMAYGQKWVLPGVHVMECPTDHWVETLTGLAGCGSEVVVVCTAGDGEIQGHPLVPVIQVATGAVGGAEEVDLVLAADSATDLEPLARIVLDVLHRKLLPLGFGRGDEDFQFTRGALGVSS
jgi:altronate dehydratase